MTHHITLAFLVNAPLIGVIVLASVATHRARRRLALMKPEVGR